MKEQIQTLLTTNTPVELAEEILDFQKQLEYKNEEIEKLNIALKYYKSAANLVSEVNNMATEKKRGDIRTQKFIKDGE